MGSREIRCYRNEGESDVARATACELGIVMFDL